MKSCFLIREYSDQTITLKMEKSQVCLRRIISISQILVYIILLLKYLVKLRVNYNVLYTQIMLKKVFTPPSPVSYCSARNISSNLVQAKIQCKRTLVDDCCNAAPTKGLVYKINEETDTFFQRCCREFFTRSITT